MEDDQNGHSRPPVNETAGVILARAIAPLFNPVVFTAMSILFSVFILLLFTFFKWDQAEVLLHLKDGQYARGLITYLFAVGTIGSVVVLILAALTAGKSEAAAENFGRAKEIFSLLIGIFGTIIGFYFGSIKAEEEGGGAAPQVALAGLPDTAAAGSVRVIGYVTGGTRPFRYTLGFDAGTRSPERPSADGWINDSIRTPRVSRDSVVTLLVTATDAQDRTVTSTSELVLRPSAPPPAGTP